MEDETTNYGGTMAERRLSIDLTKRMDMFSDNGDRMFLKLSGIDAVNIALSPTQNKYDPLGDEFSD